jgi:hypothetical protein
MKPGGSTLLIENPAIGYDPESVSSDPHIIL